MFNYTNPVLITQCILLPFKYIGSPSVFYCTKPIGQIYIDTVETHYACMHIYIVIHIPCAHTNTHVDIQTCTETQTDRQTHTQRHRQTDTHTDRQTHTNKHIIKVNIYTAIL